MGELATTDIWISRSVEAIGPHHEPVPEDHAAAASYICERDRQRFFASRRVLRAILSEYAGIPAYALRFRRGRYGKLHLRQAHKRLHFNLSHCRKRVLVAVSLDGPVGVDVEEVRPIDANWLARCWFSRAERSEWSTIPRARRLDSFFHGWARKEAFLKATGVGLQMPLDAFSVSLDPDRAELREVRGGSPLPWRLHRIDAGSGYAAALATFGQSGIIRIREAA